MKVSELIKKLQEFPKDMDVQIFDWKKNLSEDFGEGSSAGIYELKVEGYDLSDLEILKEVHGRTFKPFVQLTFNSEDYDNEGGRFH
mgnify:CR=1 FL=1